MVYEKNGKRGRKENRMNFFVLFVTAELNLSSVNKKRKEDVEEGFC